jgi:glyoxylase-like metal-dependent hydrolase (beta-lactamase superfamily II)/8-oxo-dGTP pyrophosphatase MutT (NUDIX family)
MSNTSAIVSAPARAAATLLVLRDGAKGLEILMLKRPHRAGDHSSGAFVFPGGKVDAEDQALGAVCAGLDGEAASRRLGLPQGGLNLYACAIRECFEESGLLLASREDGSTVGALGTETAAALDGGLSLRSLCESRGWRLAAGALAYHSHWLTPLGLAKRFDTRFFVALAPEGQAVRCNSEAVEHRWVRPADALAAADMVLPNPTRRTLQAIAGYASARECLEATRTRTQIPCIFPRLATGGAGPRPIHPDEGAYAEIGHVDPQGQGHASYELRPGHAVRLSQRIWRVTAPNGNAMTGPGTNSYFVGEGGNDGPWALIDPGPDDDSHVQALIDSAPGPVRWILATHTHKDHSPAAVRIREAFGAELLGRTTPHTQWQDLSFVPDRELVHGERLSIGPHTTLRVIHTPGHASNHLCFLLEEEKTLFTGDHVMQGSSVVISPPDGSMADYVASLRLLLEEDLDWLAPGHGFLMDRPAQAVQLRVRHRLKREAKVVAALRDTGEAPLRTLLPRVYDDVPQQLLPVAERSLLAHLHKLAADGVAHDDGDRWRLLEAPKPILILDEST